jgi:hypothetical protein
MPGIAGFAAAAPEVIQVMLLPHCAITVRIGDSCLRRCEEKSKSGPLARGQQLGNERRPVQESDWHEGRLEGVKSEH